MMTSLCRWEQKLESPFPIGSGEKAWLCHELGYCYIEVEGFEKARECGEKSLEAAKQTADKQWLLNASILVAQALCECSAAAAAGPANQTALAPLATEVANIDYSLSSYCLC